MPQDPEFLDRVAAAKASGEPTAKQPTVDAASPEVLAEPAPKPAKASKSKAAKADQMTAAAPAPIDEPVDHLGAHAASTSSCRPGAHTGCWVDRGEGTVCADCGQAPGK